MCGFKKSVPRDDRTYLDPESCPHENVNHMKSSKDFINYYCMDCGTSIDRKPRGDAERAKQVARAIELSNTRVQRVASKLATDPTFTKQQGLAVVRIFEDVANGLITQQTDDTVSCSFLQSILQDCMDMVHEHNLGNPQSV